MERSNNIELDFEGEFTPIKLLSAEEIKHDRLIKLLQQQRKLQRLESLDSLEVSGATIEAEPPARKYYKNHSKTKQSLSETTQREDQEPINTDAAIAEEVSKNTFGQNSNNEDEEAKKRKMRSQKLKHLKLLNIAPETGPAYTEHDSGAGISELLKESDVTSEFSHYRAQSLDVDFVKRLILSQLSNKPQNFRNIRLSPILAEKAEEMLRMLDHTVSDREGHSSLLIGPRGSGKTAIIEHALSYLERKYPDQFICIRLSAHIHSDDSVALRDIARQLDFYTKKISQQHGTSDEGKEDDDALKAESTNKFEQRSISDTFSNILSILDRSGSESHSDQDTEKDMSIIFIVDEFDKFTTGHKQTLLYNLFDLSQNSKIPVSVIGVSSKITARELLEKRVRSRFSQRLILINKPLTIDDFWQNARLNLTIDPQSFSTLQDPEYGKLWNKYIDSLYSRPTNLLKLVYQNYYTVKNFKDFNNSCFYAIAQISPRQPFPLDTSFLVYARNQSPNNTPAVIEALSDLEAFLIIAAARWIEKSLILALNFPIAYNEYVEMMKAYNASYTTSNSSSIISNNVLSNLQITQKIWPAKVMRNCWESLYKLGLLLDYGAITTNAEGQIIATSNSNKNILIEESKMVQLDITLNELNHLFSDLNIFKSLSKL